MQDEQAKQVVVADGTHAGDVEWVADLIDTYRAGDVDAAITHLESLLGQLKRASKARRALAQVPARRLRAAVERHNSGARDA